jgi:hypothetical protein
VHIAIWIVAALIIGLWSLAAWGVSALLGLNPAWVGNLQNLLREIPYGAWVETWVPHWQPGLLVILDLARDLFAWVDAAAPAVLWIIWVMGTVAVVMLAALLSLVVRTVSKSAAPARPQAA